ncbi:hypothetical protein ILYODFUR_029890 [Ilyodon furcidens]|uniref:Uncharacterized protein n=1 Tax=Ilyodon furcidens TaxID=33524 RepID=A0ABV0TFQ2_9TELE
MTWHDNGLTHDTTPTPFKQTTVLETNIAHLVICHWGQFHVDYMNVIKVKHYTSRSQGTGLQLCHHLTIDYCSGPDVDQSEKVSCLCDFPCRSYNILFFLTRSQFLRSDPTP